MNGANILRVHDVKPAKEAVRLVDACMMQNAWDNLIGWKKKASGKLRDAFQYTKTFYQMP